MTAFVLNDDGLIVNAIEVESIEETDKNIVKYIEGLWIGQYYPTIESLYTELETLRSISYRGFDDETISIVINQI